LGSKIHRLGDGFQSNFAAEKKRLNFLPADFQLAQNEQLWFKLGICLNPSWSCVVSELPYPNSACPD
jgi:hypothetical protein